MARTNYTLIDAADELRRIGPQLGAAVRELDRLCERLPQELVNRIEAAAPELEHYSTTTGARLSALAQEMQAEVDAMPQAEHEAMMQRIEERRRAERRRPGLAWGRPPSLCGGTLPLARLDALQGADDGGEAA